MWLQTLTQSVSSCHSHFSPRCVDADGCHGSGCCRGYCAALIWVREFIQVSDWQRCRILYDLYDLDFWCSRCSFLYNENIYWPGAVELQKLKKAPYNESKWGPALFELYNYFYFFCVCVFCKKKVMQIWNNMRVDDFKCSPLKNVTDIDDVIIRYAFWFCDWSCL